MFHINQEGNEITKKGGDCSHHYIPEKIKQDHIKDNIQHNWNQVNIQNLFGLFFNEVNCGEYVVYTEKECPSGYNRSDKIWFDCNILIGKPLKDIIWVKDGSKYEWDTE